MNCEIVFDLLLANSPAIVNAAIGITFAVIVAALTIKIAPDD